MYVSVEIKVSKEEVKCVEVSHVSAVESEDESDAAADCGFPQLMFGDYPSSEADNFTISTLSTSQAAVMQWTLRTHDPLMGTFSTLQNFFRVRTSVLHTDEHGCSLTNPKPETK